MNTPFILIATVFACFFSIPASAQFQNIRVGNALNTYEPVEPSIVIDPYNTNHILIGANTDNYYYSVDSGINWQHGVLNSTFGVGGDPCVVAGSDGYYYFHLVPDLSRVVCQKSTTLGGTWSDGSYCGLNGTKDNDKEWGTIDHGNGNLYVVWAQFDEHGSFNTQDSSEIQLARSTDGGLTWSTPVVVSDIKGNAQGGNYSNHAPMAAIGPDNELYVTWMGPEGLMFEKSTDEGSTWLQNDINVTGFHIDWLVFNIPGVPTVPGFPVINCDLSSGNYNGNIYICWTDQRSGYNDTDVWLTKSINGGLDWSPPIRVNDDPPDRHQFFAWMTVDQVTGHLYFVFYDRRNYSDLQTDVFLARSTDGGSSFANFRISEIPFTPSAYNYLGHYIGISAHDDVIRPVWTRIDNNLPSLWTALIDSVASSHENINLLSASQFELLQNYPNPFNSSTRIKFKISEHSHVMLKVYDILGNEVSTLVNEETTPGNYEVEFTASGKTGSPGDVSYIPSGIYYYQLISGNYIKSKKMVVIK